MPAEPFVFPMMFFEGLLLVLADPRVESFGRRQVLIQIMFGLFETIPK